MSASVNAPEVTGTALNIDFLAASLAAEMAVTLSLPFGDEGQATTAQILHAAITAALIAALSAAPDAMTIDDRLYLELAAFENVRASVMEQAAAHLATVSTP